MTSETHTIQRTDGSPITDRQIRRGMRINIFAGSFGMVWAAVALGMPLTMLLDSMKASGVIIGLSATIQQLAMLTQLPAAFVSEMLASRKMYWFWTAFLHRAAWLVVPALPFLLPGRYEVMAATLLVAVTISSILGQASAASWWSWMTDLIPERMRNRFWSVRQSILFTAYLVAMGASGYVLDLFPDPREPNGSFMGFSLVFGVATLLGCADIVFHMGVPEPRPVPLHRRRNVLQRVIAPLRHHDFRILTLAMGFWAFSVGLVGQFGLLYLRHRLGVTYTGISVTIISATIGTILAGLIWAYVMDRLGARNFGGIVMLIAPLCGAAWFFLRPGDVTIPVPFGPDWRVAQPVFVLTISSLIAGAFYSGVGLAQASLLGSVAPREGRTVAMAVHFSVMGLMAAAGPVAGGAIMDAFGPDGLGWGLPGGQPFDFIHALVILHAVTCWFLAVPLMARIRRRSGELGFRTALSRFLIVNPFRMISSIYNIHTMGAAYSRHGRADAIRRIGEDRTAIAVSDLVEDLDDPSLEIREAAATALGRIGSFDAVDALLARLQQADCDMVPEIARALRPTRDRRIVEPLLRLLATTREQTTAVEIIRTIGETGDRRVFEPLLDRVRTTQDHKILVAATEALCRLECFGAVYEIVQRLKSPIPAFIRKALTANLGDLLGRPGGFYPLLMREQSERGAGAEGLLDSLARAVREIGSQHTHFGAQGKHTEELVAALDTAYSQGQTSEAARLMYEIVADLARMEFGVGHPGDLDAFVEALVWQDERFAVGTWFICVLRDSAGGPAPLTPDSTDVLLGIYFLSNWCKTRS
jgi:MFS family permease